MRSKYDNRLLEEAYSSVHKESSSSTGKVLTESFRPGHGMVPAPINDKTYKAKGLRKLWGIQMRADKWADTFVGLFDDGKFAIINPEGIDKYSSASDFNKAFEKYRKTNRLEEAYKHVFSESDDNAGKIPVSAVEDLSFITVADRTSHKWVTWEVSFVYQGQEYTGFLGAVPDHPSEMHDDYIEDAEPVQTPALDEAEESSSSSPVDAFYGAFETFLGSMSDHELDGANELVRRKPGQILRMIRDEFGYRNAVYDEIN